MTVSREFEATRLDVFEELLAAGCTTMSTTANLGEPQPGDEDLKVLIVRRTTLEWVLRRAALAQGGVEIRSGAGVVGLVAVSGASFPSGHAVAAAVTAVGLVIVLLPPGHTRWVWERRAALYASLMALSRTYLDAHWLSDVVAGALLGSGIALLCPALLVDLRVRYQARKGAAVGE